MFVQFAAVLAGSLVLRERCLLLGACADATAPTHGVTQELRHRAQDELRQTEAFEGLGGAATRRARRSVGAVVRRGRRREAVDAARRVES